MTYELGVIGSGNMAEAIVRGVLAKGVFKPSQIIASDVSPQRRGLFEKQIGVKAVDDNLDAAPDAKTILLSVKPQQMGAALAGLGQVISPETLVISIAAGISSGFIERSLGAGKSWHVIRTMPNTPMLVGEGMVAIAGGAHATAQDIASARRLFEAAATVIEVSEDKIDAVTALSGSGPAYVFFLVEQMVKAGTDLGLTPDQAHKLATVTAFGSAKMLTTSTDSPAELRRKVTSPGGTTQAAITYLESHDLPATLVNAIKAAAARSKELGV